MGANFHSFQNSRGRNVFFKISSSSRKFFLFFFHESAIETLCKVNVVAIRYMAADDLRNNEKHLMDGQVVTGYS